MKLASLYVLILGTIVLNPATAQVNAEFTPTSCAPLPPVTQLTMSHKRTQTCDYVDLSAGQATKYLAYRCARGVRDSSTHTGQLEFYFSPELNVASIPTVVKSGTFVLYVTGVDVSVPGRLVVNVQHNRIVRGKSLAGSCYMHVTLVASQE